MVLELRPTGILCSIKGFPGEVEGEERGGIKVCVWHEVGVRGGRRKI